MNKYLIIGLVIVIAGIGFFGFSSSTTQYVAELATSVDELEADLAALEEKINNDALTPDEAFEAQEAIMSRMESISKSASKGGDSLSEAEKVQFAGALTRLKDALVKYQATLTTVDTAAAKSTRVAKKSRRSSGGTQTSAPVLADIVTDTIEDLEDYAEEAFEEDEYQELIEEADTTESDDVMESEEEGIVGDSEGEMTESDDTVESENNVATSTEETTEVPVVTE